MIGVIEQIVEGALSQRVDVGVDTLKRAVNEYAQSEGMRQSFRKAASDLAIEAGIIGGPVKHDEVAGSVLQDVYFLQLLAESQLRMGRMSLAYEKLRAVAHRAVDGEHSISATAVGLADLRAVLAEDMTRA